MPEYSEKVVKTINKDEYEMEIVQLKYCLEIGKEAYEQEKVRTETLKARTENLIKYSTLFIAIANLVISLVDKGTLWSNELPYGKEIYIGLMVAIILCIILALVAQRPVRTETFPDGVWMLEEICSHQEKYRYENECIYEMILRYASRTRIMRKSNDLSFILVAFSYVLYIFSIILLTSLLVVAVGI